MKKRLLVCLVALIIMFAARRFLVSRNIQNVFDEMYYGHDDASPCFLYPATYKHYGLDNIDDEMRYLSGNLVCEYVSDSLLDKDELIRIIWHLNERKLEYNYITLFGSEEYLLHFDLQYLPKDNVLIVFPVCLTKDATDQTSYLSLYLEKNSFTREDIERIFNEGFMKRVTNLWFDVNKGQSRFNQDDFGDLTIINRMFEGVPE